MELLNATRMIAGYTMGMRADGRELLVVVVKGTFLFPKEGEEAALASAQLPLVMADTFTGEPGLSAPVYECDMAHAKTRCDVLLHGSAYTPNQKPEIYVPVRLRVGKMEKSFNVVGDRLWKKTFLGYVATAPEPFTIKPFSYDRAYGGTDYTHEDAKKHRAFLANPVGRGFHVNIRRETVEGKSLPNTEEIARSVVEPHGIYRPMAFGPIGRGWEPRLKYGGTYDENWFKNVRPFLPADFDERFLQAAPEDQQIDYPKGGEEVELRNLTPEGRTAFKLPAVQLPVTFYSKAGDETEQSANLDTIVFEPDLRRFSLTWRAALPLKRNMHEIELVAAGRMPPAWYRARKLGKTWYPTLEHAAIAKKADDAKEDGS